MMALVSVKDVMSKDFATINENDTLSKCLELFKKDVPPVLAVLDDKGKYAGIIARRWIVRARLDPMGRPQPLRKSPALFFRASPIQLEDAGFCPGYFMTILCPYR